MNNIYVIAEAGVNHNGDIEIAKKLIKVASESGADAVKFQSFKAGSLVTKKAEQAKYQERNTNNTDSQYNLLKNLELDYNRHKELKDYADTQGIEFLSSAFDLESIELLQQLNIKLFKIPSGEINNVPYLKKIAQTLKPVILSTGMSTLSDIEFALNILKENGTTQLTVLHCSTEYPAPVEELNLKAMNTIKEAFKVNIGYSDHTAGIHIPIAAVAMGAKVIEKHFTLSREMEGPDHKASLEPHELSEMILNIRDIEKSFGNGIKEPSKSEINNMKVARKSIIAKEDICKGDILSEQNLTIKRPGNGISPKEWTNIVGKEANYDFKKDDLIKL